MQTSPNLSPERLMTVIQMQTEIAQLGLDLGAVMNLVSRRAQAMTGATGAVIELAEGEDMVYRASSGAFGKSLGLQRKGSLSGLCVDLGEPLGCYDSETDPRVDRDACRRVGLRSMIVAPLRHGGNVVGVLKVMSDQPATFGQEAMQILQLITGLVAAAMYHAARHESSELFYRATHDALTGLANRALFYDRLRSALSRGDGPVAVVNLDMDGLKPINDSYGHRAGDAAIREMGQRIKQVVRESDVVARLGGDEFAVMLSSIRDRMSAIAHAERITERLSLPFLFEQELLPLAASVGVAVYPEDARDPDSLLHHADQQMYAMKRTRKGAAAR